MIIKNKKHLYIFLILILIWRCIIFAFSAQPGDESTDTSIGFGAKVIRFFIPEFREMSKEELINELIKAKANELRAKKGYEVKGVGANKEYVSLNNKNTK